MDSRVLNEGERIEHRLRRLLLKWVLVRKTVFIINVGLNR